MLIDDIAQTLIDYFEIEAQRHRDVMRTLADIQAKDNDILAAIADLTSTAKAKLADHVSSHAGDLDTVGEGQDKILAAIKTASDDIAATGVAPDASVDTNVTSPAAS